MIIFEMLTKEKPFSNLKTTNEIFTEVVVKCCRPKFPEESKEEVIPCFREMIEMCWSQEPSERMTFDDIVYALKNDPRFVENDVDKEKFFFYVKMIDNKHEIEIKQKIEENELRKIEENEDENIELEKDLVQNSTKNSSSHNPATSEVQAFQNEESLITIAYNEVRDNENSMNWILVKFDASTKKWVFFNKGSNGQEEMKNSISSDFIGYCYLLIDNKNRSITQ